MAADDPWQEIADKLDQFQRRHVEFAQRITLPDARDIGERLDNLQRQYDDNGAFLKEAEHRVRLKKSQVYSYIKLHRQWGEIQCAIAAGQDITSLKAALRLLSGAVPTPALAPAAVVVDVEAVAADGQPEGAAAGAADDTHINAPTAWSRSEAAALDALRAVPGACDQLIAAVPSDRGDLVVALEELLATASRLHNQLRSALLVAAETHHHVDVQQLEITSADPAHLLADSLPDAVAAELLDAGDDHGATEQVDQVEAAPVPPVEKKKSNKGAVSGRFPVTPEGNAAFHAALADHGNSQTRLSKTLGCSANSVSQHLAKVRRFEEATGHA
jgi:hypothetical protein